VATGEMHMTTLSETNTAELDMVEPNLQRIALLKKMVTWSQGHSVSSL
jgi:hypothetical protein